MPERFVLYMIEGLVQGVIMTSVQGVNSKLQAINFKADTETTRNDYVRQPSSDEVLLNKALQERQKQVKKNERDKKISMGVSMLLTAAILASVGITGYQMFGNKGAKTIFKKISERMPSLNDGCVNAKGREFITSTVKILNMSPEVLDYTGAKNPRMVLFHGPTGTGKTFLAKMLAKEMGAEYGEIQFSDLSSEYIGRTSVNISNKFKELAKLAKKNPDKKYVVAFNEIDSLINNVEKLGSNNQHLGQNRTAFLNGLDSIKDIPNLTIVGTTNINPNSANLDPATLSRLGNIFEIQRPTVGEIVSSLKFHLSKSKAADKLIENEDALKTLAKNIEGKGGAQRDIESIVDSALQKFAIDIDSQSDKLTKKLTPDYLQNIIDTRETWAANIGSGAKNVENVPLDNNQLMEAFWNFMAKVGGVV